MSVRQNFVSDDERPAVNTYLRRVSDLGEDHTVRIHLQFIRRRVFNKNTHTEVKHNEQLFY